MRFVALVLAGFVILNVADAIDAKRTVDSIVWIFLLLGGKTEYMDSGVAHQPPLVPCASIFACG
jgi:hypothetical protein